MNVIEELKYRGLLHDISKGCEEKLISANGINSIYLGIDPTYDSLHIGHIPCLMMLKHLQKHGNKPLLVMGGATGMIGDPSGKSKERILLGKEILEKNKKKIKEQLKKFLEFDSSKINKAEILDNHEWTKEKSFISFIRDIGKHITVNYMMSKDSVKKRLDGSQEGLSFTEFCYQLMQAFDFIHLYKNKNCQFQLGGADQWGNITTGIELIRKKEASSAYGLTCPLLTKEDGGKFGKTEKGNVWLNRDYTSPYEMLMYFFNSSDSEAEKLIKMFAYLDLERIKEIIKEHNKDRSKRLLQKTLADEVIKMVHSEKDIEYCELSNRILFAKGSKKEHLKRIDSHGLNNILSPALQNSQIELSKEDIIGCSLIDLFYSKTGFISSKSEIRRSMQSNSLMLNKEKVEDKDYQIKQEDIINNMFILIQKGKKNHFLIKVKK